MADRAVCLSVCRSPQRVKREEMAMMVSVSTMAATVAGSMWRGGGGGGRGGRPSRGKFM